VALGALQGDFGLVAVFGLRGVLAGTAAGAVVGLCVAVDRITTESYLTKPPPAETTSPLPPENGRPAGHKIKGSVPAWAVARRRLQGL
jgi:hypothetical protein